MDRQRSAAAAYDLGVDKVEQGDFTEAVALLTQAITLEPTNAGYRYKLAVALQGAGDESGALDCYRKAIALDPGHARAHNNLASLLHGRRDLVGAIQHYHIALQADAQLLEAARNLAIALLEQGSVESAERYASRAVAIEGGSAELYCIWANALAKCGRYQEALSACEHAVRLAPATAAAINCLGKALRDMGRWRDAAEAFGRAVAIDPNSPELRVALAMSLCDIGRVDDADQQCRQALKIDPRFVPAWLGLGGVEETRGNRDAAGAWYEKAIQIDPGSAQAHFNLALYLLGNGEFERGWREYESRWHLTELAGLVPDFKLPQWDGRDPRGKTLLLYAEQGFGDAIQFVRYAALLRRRGASVVLRCPLRLKELMETVEDLSAVVSDEEALPDVDFCCPLLSVPRLLSPESVIPSKIPYIYADSGKAAWWRARLSHLPAGLKVGLTWGSHSGNRQLSLRKSVPLKLFAQLGDVPNVTLCSLQKGPFPVDVPNVRLLDLADEQRDFADSAALIENLDLVISVDTSVAHLAAAMGKPTWVLVPRPPDWRWFPENAPNRWYPSMRVFRQRRLFAWDEVAHDVKIELQALSRSSRY